MNFNILNFKYLVQLQKTLDFFLPRICPGCKNIVTTPKKFICDDCISEISQIEESLINAEYNHKFGLDNYIAGFTGLYLFEKEKVFQRILHELKYQSKFLLGMELGSNLASAKKDIINKWGIDVVTPIPLHRIKKHERGYNQSSYICFGIKEKLGLNIDEKIIKRVRYTDSQTMLKYEERKENMKNAFAIYRNAKIEGVNILLVDDIVTTGSTANECAKVLKNAGAKNIYLATIGMAG